MRRERLDLRLVLGRRNDVGGDRGPRDDVLWREGNRLDNSRARRKCKIHVAQVHEVHRRRGEVLDLHDDVERGLAKPQDHPWGRAIIRAEAHRVTAHPRHRHPRAPRIRPVGDPGLVHFRARGFTVHSMIVAGGGDAVAQESGMVGEAAIGLDNGLCGPRRREHALHLKRNAVERRAPHHLPHVRQDHHVAACVAEPNGVDAGVVAKEARGQAFRGDRFSLPFAEGRSLQHDSDLVLPGLHRASPQPPASPGAPIPEIRCLYYCKPYRRRVHSTRPRGEECHRSALSMSAS